ncbi:Panacea domain-containing protein [Flavobacterium sp. KJJ]|uniref:Panacea domain-containing protein n=1 Tax=Flavobacterium sp. KJJ TaxID=1270193 RepID=UPI00068975E2|nr:type II toxin-antitoxin system antitoxin SocA domain-containing protein [Flavobacterium sp. KJJ]
MSQSALFLAGEILKRAKEQNIGISNMSLQKLLFIANGLYLAKKGKPLFNEPIEVWPYGPVIKSVYHEFKEYGNTDIKKIPIAYTMNLDKEFDATANEAINFALQVAQNLNAIQLSNWTHLPESPWANARNNNDDYISNESIAEYFQRFIEQQEQL